MRANHWLLTAFAVSVPALAAQTAFAGTDACGDFNFEAGMSCEIKTSGGCTASCTPLTVDAECHAELSVTCDGQCNLPSVNCDVGCQGGCEASCKADAQFDCSASCKTSCEANCSGECASSADKTQCEGSCKASCGGSCDASCEGKASADCSGKCSASCDAQCHVKSNLDCQVTCQSKGYATCTADVQGGCTADCSQPEGALFCNGQYVNVDNLDDCLAQLLTEWDIKASGYAYGNCDNGTCSGEAGGSVSCSTSSVGAGDYALGAFGVLGMIGLGLGLTRRRFIKA